MLQYTAAFKRPAFELRDRTADVMRSMHQKLNSSFDLDLDDMRSFDGFSVRNARIELDLFDGHGQIKLDPSALFLNFKDICSRDEINICVECISLSRKALQESLPNVEIEGFEVGLGLECKIDGEAPSVDEYLSRVVGNKFLMKFDKDTFGNVLQHGRISVEAESADAGWRVILDVARARGDVSSALVTCDVLYDGQSAYVAAEKQASHLESLLNVFLDSIDMRVRLGTEQ